MSNTAGGAISQSECGRSLLQRTTAEKSSIRNLANVWRSQLELLTSAERALDALDGLEVTTSHEILRFSRR